MGVVETDAVGERDGGKGDWGDWSGESEPLAAGEAPFSFAMPDRRGCSVGEVTEDLLRRGICSVDNVIKGGRTYLYRGENALSIFR